MKRLIKFRAIVIGESTGFMYGFPEIIKDTDRIPLRSYEDANWVGYMTPIDGHTRCGEGFQVNIKTISQFTGIYDSEGVEIYEGDIISMITPNIFKKYKTRKYEVKWSYAKWVAIAIDGEFEKVYPKSFSESERVECKVIGNIYENQQILNK